MRTTLSLTVGALALVYSTVGLAQEKLTFLLPQPAYLPGFVSYQLAKAKGHYRAEGLDVEFLSGKGGADVAKQVGAKNVDLGIAIGDAPILVRSNGVPVKGVALFGSGGLTQIIVRKDAGITSLKDLKGKRIGILSFQSASYYALQAVLAKHEIARDQVSIQAVGQGGIVKLLAAGSLDAIVNVVENAAELEALGVSVDMYSVDEVFPVMAHSILASEAMIAERPQTIRSFVKATLAAIRLIIDDPKKAAHDYVAAIPQQAGKEAFIENVLRRQIAAVYRPGKGQPLGQFDPARLEEAQNFYFSHGIIQRKSPISDLYTNEFAPL